MLVVIVFALLITLTAGGVLDEPPKITHPPSTTELDKVLVYTVIVPDPKNDRLVRYTDFNMSMSPSWMPAFHFTPAQIQLIGHYLVEIADMDDRWKRDSAEKFLELIGVDKSDGCKKAKELAHQKNLTYKEVEQLFVKSQECIIDNGEKLLNLILGVGIGLIFVAFIGFLFELWFLCVAKDAANECSQEY